MKLGYHIEQGDYASVYSIGDTIPLDLGSEGKIHMQIAGFDVDDLADGSGKAHVSFISKEVLKTAKRWNPEGTGTSGGWEKSELRTYIRETIQLMIPAEVRSMVKTVTKSHSYYTTTGVEDTQSTDDDVWIPSNEEVVGSESLYYPLYKDIDENRKKYNVATSSLSSWWLRSAYNKYSACLINGGGKLNDLSAYRAGGYIALGFCV